MQIFNGVWKKIVSDTDKLTELTKALRNILGYKIVTTIGTWDMLHIGHVRYLIKAKTYGDILIVGTDTDRAVKLYKGELRPIIPQGERLEMLSYQSCVDLVTLVDDINENGEWQYNLIKKIKPDVFVAVENSYPPEQQEEIKRHCQEIIVLPMQAKNTSTSKKIQETIKKSLTKILSDVDKLDV